MNIYAVLGSAESEITEKKSRFIANIHEVHSEEDAIAFIDSVRKQHWDARHVCYAYVIGGTNKISRFSDDKEPQGTAGKPILEVIEGSAICNCVITVTRYFGGVLLGTGGLVRAYSQAAKAAVGALGSAGSGKLLPVLSGYLITFSCDYKDISRFDSLCYSLGMCTVEKDYLEKAVYTMIIETESLDKFLKEADNITRGSFSLTKKETVCYCPEGQEAYLYRL